MARRPTFLIDRTRTPSSRAGRSRAAAGPHRRGDAGVPAQRPKQRLLAVVAATHIAVPMLDGRSPQGARSVGQLRRVRRVALAVGAVLHLNRSGHRGEGINGLVNETEDLVMSARYGVCNERRHRENITRSAS